MAWLLDTNILSEGRKPRPEPKVVTFVSGTPLDELYVSAVTLAELRFGIDLLSHGSTQRANLTQWLTHTIRPMFNDRVFAGYRRYHIPVARSDGKRAAKPATRFRSRT